ncbi:MAG: hypothetical protein GKC53_03680 [Neisseriaceae bacterium]|nr:MAG: hypothetical protein GKC53_03680 [Neisseriaceae bacterium]
MHNTIFHITSQLLKEKLEFVTVNPNDILIVGSDYGSSRRILNDIYSARLTEMDIDRKRFENVTKNTWLSKLLKKNQNFQLLNLEQSNHQKNQYDFIVSNLYLSRMNAYKEKLFNLWKSSSKPNSMLFFSFLGLGSFQEIYQLFDYTIKNKIPPYHMDMHDIGDELIRLGFIDPVVSMENMSMIYEKNKTLINDLNSLGVLPTMLSCLNINYQEFNDVLNRLEKNRLNFKVSYEFVFAHAIYKTKDTLSPKKEQKIMFYPKR